MSFSSVRYTMQVRQQVDQTSRRFVAPVMDLSRASAQCGKIRSAATFNAHA
jgi:hypothetical protein